MVGRTPKYSQPRTISGYLDADDLKFIDDHRGKIGRMPFLMECMYAAKGIHEKLKITDSEISRLKTENHELKTQLLFEQSKRTKAIAPTNTIELIKKAISLLSKWNIGKDGPLPLKFHANLCKVEPAKLEAWVKQFNNNEWHGEPSKIDAFLEKLNLKEGVS